MAVINTTIDELRDSVIEILNKYNMSLKEFLETNRDEFESAELSDLSLFVRDKLQDKTNAQ